MSKDLLLKHDWLKKKRRKVLRLERLKMTKLSANWRKTT